MVLGPSLLFVLMFSVPVMGIRPAKLENDVVKSEIGDERSSNEERFAFEWNMEAAWRCLRECCESLQRALAEPRLLWDSEKGM